jgi:DNA-binding MarR family transcriptional regulator
VLITELYWMTWKLLERRLYALEVSGSQARVLATLHFANEPIKPSAIAILLFQETQSITGILHRIESRGWVTRTPDAEDHRAVNLELTPAGSKVAQQIARVSKDLYEELFSPALTANERRQLEAALRKLRTRGFQLPETDFRLRRAQQFQAWSG